MLFYLAIVIYILSLAGSLILFIVSKKISSLVLNVLLAFHFLLLIPVLIRLLFKDAGFQLPFFIHISFLLFCCSGLLIFGILINKPKKKLMNLYFGVFMATVPMFIFKPSGLMHILLYMEIKNTKKESFAVGGNLFLEKQQTTAVSGHEHRSYKLVSKKGLYTKTIQRDILFRYPLDSLKTLAFHYPDSITIRAFFQISNQKTDSTDSQIYFNNK